MKHLVLALLAVGILGIFATSAEASGRYWRRAHFYGPPRVVVAPVVPRVGYYHNHYYRGPVVTRDYYVTPRVEVYRPVPVIRPHIYGPRISVGIGF